MPINGIIHEDLPPPAVKRFYTKDRVSFVFEFIWLVILVVPHILLAFLRTIFSPGKSLKGQVALVTGAGRGIGKGLAVALAEEGCSVAVVDVNFDNAKETAEEICRNGGKAKAYCTNVARIKEIHQLHQDVRKDLGPVELLVNNAGIIYADNVEDYLEEAITGIINVNLLSHFWMIREFLPSMKERNSGHIVAMNSTAAFSAVAKNSAYAACKFGVRALMESLRAELEDRPGNRIKTTSVHPHFTNTSSYYVDHWELRLPVLSTDEVVKAAIKGIKMEDVTVTVPSILYYALHLRWMLPQSIFDKTLEIFTVRFIVPSKSVREKLPQTAIIKDLANERINKQ